MTQSSDIQNNQIEDKAELLFGVIHLGFRRAKVAPNR
jgi:hypothetical protein